MILDLKPIFNIEGKSLEFNYEIDLSGEELNDAYPFTTPVTVKGSIFNRAGIVEMQADVDCSLDICCDRCAKPFKYPFDLNIDHTLVSSLENEDNDDLILIDDMNFNLDELVADDIFLNLPVKFLCKEDCKGICPGCGVNLNEGKCSCKKEVDPRLAALQQLLDN